MFFANAGGCQVVIDRGPGPGRGNEKILPGAWEENT